MQAGKLILQFLIFFFNKNAKEIFKDFRPKETKRAFFDNFDIIMELVSLILEVLGVRQYCLLSIVYILNDRGQWNDVHF